MEGTTIQKTITVQVDGSPVPASDRGEKAGPGTSSTNDCNNATGVNHLAPAAATATSAEEEKSQALERLGGLITKLQDFMKDKKNIHHEAKRMVASVKSAFNKLYELESATDRKPKEAGSAPATAEGETQTTPPPRLLPNANTGNQDLFTPLQNRAQENKRKKRTPPSPETTAAKRKKKKEPKNLPEIRPKQNNEPKRTEILRDAQGPSHGWQDVRRKPRKQRTKPTLPNALVVKKKGDMTYAEILSKVKRDPQLEEVGKMVKRIRRTAAGDLIFILDKASTAETAEMRSTIEEVLGQEAAVTSRVQEKLIEIKDLDETTTKEEICESLAKQFGVDKGIAIDSIKTLRKAYGETQTAVVRLPAELAKKVVDTGKIRIGWVVCRAREQLKPTKCYKCWQYGHLSRNCRREIDRSETCMKCGRIGHKVEKCQGDAHCVLCEERGSMKCGHIAGSSRCPAYIKALQELTRKRI